MSFLRSTICTKPSASMRARSPEVSAQIIAHRRHADVIASPLPEPALQRDSPAHRPVDLGERPRLGLAVAPAIAPEGADIPSDLLLHVHAEAVLLRARTARRREIQIGRAS